MKKKILKFILAIFMILPCGAVMTACGNNDGDGDSPPTTQSPAKPGDSSASLTSVEAEVVTTDLLEKYDEDTKTFEIEYGDSMPRAEDFVVTENYSDGTEKVVTDFRYVCPAEFYESRMVVREQPYEFAIEKDEKRTYFYIKVVKKNIAKPTKVISEEMIYNGSLHTLNFNGFDSNLMTVSNNKFVDANNYTATISLKDTDNYMWADGTVGDASYEWSISKLKLDSPTIVGEYTYTGETLSAILDFNGNNEDLFTVTNHQKVDAGSVNVSVKLNITTNYEWKTTTEDTVTVSWTINPKKVLNDELPSIVGDDMFAGETKYKYTGEPIKAKLSNKFDSSFMSVENDTQSAVGVFKLKITLDSNHEFADEGLKILGYYELEWEIVKTLDVVNLNGYSIDSWTGTFNTVYDENVKTIELSGLPEQVNVTYVHQKGSEVVSELELSEFATYTTTAIISFNEAYASTHRLPTAADLEYLPVAENARYETVVVKENSIEISLTWKIYTKSKDITYTWTGSSSYVYDGTEKAPTAELSDMVAFEVDYIFYKYNEVSMKYERIDRAPSDVGRYKVKAIAVSKMYVMPSKESESFEFEIVAN